MDRAKRKGLSAWMRVGAWMITVTGIPALASHVYDLTLGGTNSRAMAGECERTQPESRCRSWRSNIDLRR